MAPVANPFKRLVKNLDVDGAQYKYFDLSALNDSRYSKLPFSIRILLEAAVRCCDNFQVKEDDVEKILDWEVNQLKEDGVEVAFKPARVLLQDFTGVPCVVDFAAMRDAMMRLGGDPDKINPLCPTDLVIDHSVQVDFARSTLRNSPNPGGGNQLTSSIPGQNLCNVYAKGSELCKIRPLHSEKFSESSLHSSRQESDNLSTHRSVFRTCVNNHTVPSRTEKNCLEVASRPCRFRPTNFGSRNSSNSSNCSNSSNSRLSCNVKNIDCKISHPSPHPQLPLQYGTCPFHNNKTIGSDAIEKNLDVEFERNKERFVFLKWGAKAFRNMTIVPPGSGICHQVNLEYLARVVFNNNGLLYPDSVVGADSHTTMINGLGVVGWGVGGIEAEAVMLGQAISMVLPKVVGYKIYGKLNQLATSTDVVLTITKHLRQVGVVGKFVEFFGPGVSDLSIADRATISNMCPEYGATIGFFPVDGKSLLYLQQTGRDDKHLKYVEQYLKAVHMYRNYDNSNEDPIFSETVELDLNTIVPSVSGPKRPHDRVAVSDMKSDFKSCLSNKVGFKGFGISTEKLQTSVPFTFDGSEYLLNHGAVVIAAITSCTNTSNPSVMLGAGLLAKKAVENGLSVPSYIKTSLSPGSGVVTYYLQESGVFTYLEKLGFDVVGYGCMTCIGNSGPLPEGIPEAIDKGEIVACGVLSGNRNFEGRIHPHTRANYLASPLLVVAYALAGTVDIDFEREPIGKNSEGLPVYLRDIWPTRNEIQEVECKHVIPSMFVKVYSQIQHGNGRWNTLNTPDSLLYPWDQKSTYIKSPPFFENMTLELPPVTDIKNARVLVHLGDSVTTDHISPAGSISRNSPAARYLAGHGLTPREFNSYGARRGNDAIMARGTFANIRLQNRFVGKAAPKTVHLESLEQMDVFDAAERYRSEGQELIILAGKDYGCGSSRDWAAKGPYLMGVRAVIAESFERIHRSNLIGMSIIPMQYLPGQNADTLGLSGKEKYTIKIPNDLTTGQKTTVELDDGRTFEVIIRFDTEVELTYFRHGGILQYMIRQMFQ